MTAETPWAGRTDAVRETLKSEREVLGELARLVPETPVLDVGCGPGFLQEYVDGRYIGADFEPEWGPDILADACRLPLPDDAVPTVVTKTTLQHIPDWKQAVRECIRVASECVVFAERTHRPPTEVVDREPVLRRRFSAAGFWGHLTTVSNDFSGQYRQAHAITSDADERIWMYRREL